MKTTLDIPDALFREAKLTAAREGTTLRAVVTRALEAELTQRGQPGAPRPWHRVFGALNHLHAETEAVDRAVADEFEQIDPDAWR